MLDYSLHYRKWHDGSQRDFDRSSLFYRNLLANLLAPVSFDARILDIGCGQGLLLYALRRFGFKNVQGVDLSEEQIAIGRQYGLACCAVGREYVPNLATTDPGTLDLVFMLDVLEHLGKAEQLLMLDCISRLLVPGGRLILSVPNASASFGLRWRYIDWTHEAAFTEHSLEFILLNSGFMDIKFLPYEFVSRPRLAFIPRKASFLWAMQKFFRLFRRLEAVSEMGDQGWNVPLSLNLLAQCTKADAKL